MLFCSEVGHVWVDHALYIVDCGIEPLWFSSLKKGSQTGAHVRFLHGRAWRIVSC